MWKPSRPNSDYICNELVNRIPLVDLRMRAYRFLGLQLEDVATTLIMLHAELTAPSNIHIGSRSSIGRHTLLDGRGGIRIGCDVNISSYSLLITGTHDPGSPDFDAAFEPISIGDRAWLGTRAMVLGGVTIGTGAVVAAQSVVTKDVAPYTIVGGAPARYIRDRPGGLDYELSWRPDWM